MKKSNLKLRCFTIVNGSSIESSAKSKQGFGCDILARWSIMMPSSKITLFMEIEI